MAEVTLGFDELDHCDLPPVCIVCGARHGVAFVQRRFMWRPVFAPGLIMMLTTKRVTAALPLCPEHGGPRLFATQRFTWWGLKTVAIGADSLTLGRVSDAFADALYPWREQRRRGAIAAPPPPPHRAMVQVGRGTGGGGTALMVLGIIAAVLVGGVVLMVFGVFAVMALFARPRAAAPPAPPWPTPVAAVPAANPAPPPEGVVVGLLAAAPQVGGPAALPWAPLALAARKATFHLLEDAEVTQALVDLKSRDPGAVADAAKKLAAAVPDPARRREAAEALTAATTNPFPFAREAAAQGLSVWGTADDVPALARMLADPFPNVKTATIAALAGLKDPKAAALALPELEKAARDRNPTVAKAAADAVKTVQDRQKLEEKHP